MEKQTILVIHPKDPTTDFIAPVYESLDATVIRDSPTSDEELRHSIDSHDRVLIFGHGTPGGLCDLRDAIQKMSRQKPFIIDRSHTKLLRSKAHNSFFIWCHADQFVKRERLQGFYTGMFISEEQEAKQYGVKATQADVDESNQCFVECLKCCVTKADSSEIQHELVTGAYAELSKTNPVAAYNLERLYCRSQL
jgi:hypothetical protein